jgi:hypothetical protein
MRAVRNRRGAAAKVGACSCGSRPRRDQPRAVGGLILPLEPGAGVGGKGEEVGAYGFGDDAEPPVPQRPRTRQRRKLPCLAGGGDERRERRQGARETGEPPALAKPAGRAREEDIGPEGRLMPRSRAGAAARGLWGGAGVVGP